MIKFVIFAVFTAPICKHTDCSLPLSPSISAFIFVSVSLSYSLSLSLYIYIHIFLSLSHSLSLNLSFSISFFLPQPIPLFKSLTLQLCLTLPTHTNTLAHTLCQLIYLGIFTIAELIRASREARKPEMTLEVIKWGTKEGVRIPFGVVSDAVSYVYRFVCTFFAK